MSSRIVHGTAVAVDGRGVLLLGPSGAGKSDVALRLIDGGAVLIADDRTIVAADGDCLLACPPPTIAGRIEARGVGILALPYAEAVPLALAVQLGPPPERLPSTPAHYDMHGVALPLIHVDPRAPGAAALVRLALKHPRVSP